MSGRAGHAGLAATEDGVARIQSALAEADLDGWLFYEFRGQNWVAAHLLGTEETTRRAFVLVPRTGRPRALLHAIEASHWRHWPFERRTYAGWRELDSELAALVEGRPRLAMEISPGNHVPTLDLVPSGVVERVRAAGVEPVSSGDLVSRFHAVWSREQLAGHLEAAEVVARVAREAMARAAEAVREERPTTEGALSDWIRSALRESGVGVDVDTHVAVGAGAADPHYAPSGAGRTIQRGDVLLVDLWGRTSPSGVAADQTWMGVLAAEAPPRVAEVWEVVRRARDAAIRWLRDHHEAAHPVRGCEVDDVARAVIREAGFGDYFVHRTGHSIDTRLHGSGPNLDNLETRDDRVLLHGVGFSIEPGIYLPGDVGFRTEIDVYMGPDGPEVTTPDPQHELHLIRV